MRSHTNWSAWAVVALASCARSALAACAGAAPGRLMADSTISCDESDRQERIETAGCVFQAKHGNEWFVTWNAGAGLMICASRSRASDRSCGCTRSHSSRLGSDRRRDAARRSEERRRSIETYEQSGRTLDAFARTGGISDWTMRCWIQRYRAGGPRGSRLASVRQVREDRGHAVDGPTATPYSAWNRLRAVPGMSGLVASASRSPSHASGSASARADPPGSGCRRGRRA